MPSSLQLQKPVAESLPKPRPASAPLPTIKSANGDSDGNKKKGVSLPPPAAKSPLPPRRKQPASLPVRFGDDAAVPTFSPVRPGAKQSPKRRLPQPQRQLSPDARHHSVPLPPSQKARQKYASLPLAFPDDAETPKYEQKSFDKQFWENYKTGQDIRKYVTAQIKKYNLELEPIDKTKRGELCKVSGKSLKLFKYQILNSVLGSPYSPIHKMLVIASTGTGKSCILVGIVNYHIDEKKIVFVGATLELYTNFVQQGMRCPGRMQNIANGNGWTDPSDPNHVKAFAQYMKRYVIPLNYTMFANLLSGKYKKYENIDSLENKLILMDEAHVLIDSIDTTTCRPSYTRVSPMWRENLRTMYNALMQPQNAVLKNTRLIGATATPLTSSLAELFMLVNLFTDKPVPQAKLCECVRTIGQIEDGGHAADMAKVLSVFDPIFSQSVTTYFAKTLTKTLDTNLFPDMVFEDIYVPLSDSQHRILDKHF